LTIDAVRYGFVAHIYLKKIFTFRKGHGAYCNGEKLTSSHQNKLQDALISAYILGDRQEYLERMYPLLRQLTNLRCFGSAAYEICLVASGGLEAYIDIRNRRLTPENFIAAAPMLQEAGGIITDERGEKLAPIDRLDEGYNFVASGNQELHEAILKYLAS
jgi:myo-inositol-1(or 4)-monophosphatase